MAAPGRPAIVGSGNVGSALARLCARAGVEVDITNTRGPRSLRELAASIGAAVHPVALDEALARELVLMAVPFGAVAAVGARRADWTGTIVVDTTNAYYTPGADEILRGRLSSAYVAEHLPGASLVKAFNQLPADTLQADPDPADGRRVVFLATDVPAAGDVVAGLVSRLGLAPVSLGRLDEGGRLIQAPGPLVLRHLVEHPLR